MGINQLERALCVWKKITEHDREKRERGKKDYTLENPSFPCHECDGYDINCSRYHVLEVD